MKRKLLDPDQIVTLRDYPVHNEQILKIYFRVFSSGQGKILPPCPVIHKSAGIPYATGEDAASKRYNALLKGFLDAHPRAEYFLLDGSHKTTAATLAHKRIPVMIIEKDKDLAEAKRLMKTGELFGWYSVESSVREAAEELAKHHLGTKEFWSVEDKTRRMVKERVLPTYIISEYSNRGAASRNSLSKK